MKEHFVRPNCSQTRLAVLYHNALFIDVGFVTLSAQNTTVGTRALYIISLPSLAKVLKIIYPFLQQEGCSKTATIPRDQARGLLCRYQQTRSPPGPQELKHRELAGRTGWSWTHYWCLTDTGIRCQSQITFPSSTSQSPAKDGVCSVCQTFPFAFALSQTIGLYFCVRKQVIILKTKLSAKVQDPCSEKYTSIFRLGTSAVA